MSFGNCLETHFDGDDNRVLREAITLGTERLIASKPNVYSGESGKTDAAKVVVSEILKSAKAARKVIGEQVEKAGGVMPETAKEKVKETSSVEAESVKQEAVGGFKVGEPVTFKKTGDFWNYAGDRAKEIAGILDVTVATRNGKPLVGIPYHAIYKAEQQLRDAGINVVFEQAPKSEEPRGGIPEAESKASAPKADVAGAAPGQEAAAPQAGGDESQVFQNPAIYLVSENKNEYQQDLFGNPVPNQSRKARGAAPNGDVHTVATVSGEDGEYLIKTALVTESQKTIGASQINTDDDAATAFEYLGRKAVEHFDVIVTDKKGRPLAIIGSFKGAIDQAAVYPGTILSEAVRIEGAANIWMAHNHPSGLAEASASDRNLTAGIAKAFSQTGIDVRSSLVIAGNPGSRRYSNVTSYSLTDMPVNAPTQTAFIPVMSLDIIESNPGDVFNSPSAARNLHNEVKQSGVLLLTTQHKKAAFYPIDDWSSIIKGGRLRKLFTATSTSGSGAAIILNKSGASDNEVRNVANALKQAGVRVLDVVSPTANGVARSWAEYGKDLTSSTALFSHALPTENRDEQIRLLADKMDVDRNDAEQMYKNGDRIDPETGDFQGGGGMGYRRTTPANNPHTLSTLAAAIDKVMGNGFTKLLEATGKFKLITSDQIDTFLKGGAKFSKSSQIELDDDAIYELDERRSEVKEKMLSDFVKNPDSKQAWGVIPSGRLSKIWNTFADTGLIHDIKGLDSIVDRVIENTIRIEVNTEMMGHDRADPHDVLNDHLGDWAHEYDIGSLVEKFRDYATDEKGNWRISDYGVFRLNKIIEQLVSAKTPEQKLMLVDQALNVVHQRSDLASYFVEGGTKTLSQLSAKPGAYDAADIDYRYGGDIGALVDRASKANKPADESVAQDQTDTPDIRYSKSGRILAFVIGGQTYLVADNISQTDDNVKGLLMHEISVHALKLGKTDAEFQKILTQIDTMRKMGNAKVMAAHEAAKGSAEEYVKSKIADVDARFMVAWHGSPHDHDKFDSSKIGTGEGAQEYGYGLYFAEAREVAEYYQKNLSQFSRIDGKPLAGNKTISSGARTYLLAENADLPKAIQNARDAIARKPDNELLPPILKELESLNPDSITKSSAGQLYQVELAPATEDYLLWDKPLSEQSEKVKAALRKKEAQSVLADAGIGFEAFKQDGNNLYNRIALHFASDKMAGDAKGDKAASEYLHSIGIRGIKYLDGSSRSKGEGNYNYVIFRDEDVSITAKFAVSGRSAEQSAEYAKLREEIIKTEGYNEVMREETAAYLIQHHPDLTISQKLIAWFRAAIRKLGKALPGMQRMQWFKAINALTFEDVVYMAQQALKSAPQTLGQAQDRGTFKAEQQKQSQTDTPAFRKWFGDSKVVNAEGRPLVVYHGTGSRDIASFLPEGGREGDWQRALEHFKSAQGKNERYGYMNFRSGTFFSPDPEYAGNYTAENTGVMYPVYIKAENPIYFDQVTGKATGVNPNKTPDALILHINGKINEVAVIDPTQIKSATGNAGSFSPTNPDIRFSRAPLIAPATKERASKTADALIYNWVDKFNDLLNVQKELPPSNEEADAFLAQERYSKVTQAKIDDLHDDRQAPLVKAIHESGLDYDSIQQYLWAKHAPEYNAEMKKRNPTQEELDELLGDLTEIRDSLADTDGVKEYKQLRDKLATTKTAVDEGDADQSAADVLQDQMSTLRATNEDVAEYLNTLDKLRAYKGYKPFVGDNTWLSGMTDAKAEEVIQKASSEGKRDKFEKIAKMVYQITDETKQLMLDSGLITKAEYDAWGDLWKYYVPMHRDEVASDMPMLGQGFNIRGKESKHATGSTKEVTNILAHVMAKAEATIIRSEKVKVDRALGKYVLENPDSDLWEYDAIETTPTLNQITGLVEHRIDPRHKSEPNVLVYKIDGKEHTITFNKQNPEMVRLAAAIKNMSAQELGEVTQLVGKATRFLATMNTSANPVFVFTNFLRDLGTAYVNLTDTELHGKKLAVYGNIPKAIRGMWNMSRGKMDSEWAKHAREFRDNGGVIGYLEFYDSIGKRTEKLKGMVEDLGPGGKKLSKRAAFEVWNTIEDANKAVENGVRLAAYIEARKSGMSVKKAVSLSNNMTVNFTRKGAKSVEFNMWYMFANASIQGSARMLKALGNKKVQHIVGGIIASGFMLDMLARAMAGDDDDDGENDYDQLPDHVKQRNFVFWIGNRPFTIPMPYGYNLFHNVGRIMSATMGRKDYGPAKGAVEALKVAVDAFNPVGQSGSLAQLITPTVGDPIAQWAENKNFAGAPLRKDQSPFGIPKPEYQMAFRSVSAPAQWLSEFLNDLSGGSQVRPGIANINPAFWDFAISSVFGGAGKTYLQTASLPMKIASDEEIQGREVPGWNIFMGRKPEHQVERRFYENLKAVETTAAEMKLFAGDRDKLIELRKDRGAEIRVMGLARIANVQVQKINERERMIEKNNPPNKRELLKLAAEQKERIQANFNKQLAKAAN